MAWTYTVALLATSQLMQARFEIGDTDTTDQLLQDEEILYAISIENGVIGGAARCCEALARKYARMADNSLGPSSVKLSQQFEHYAKIAKELRARIIGFNAPTAGGIYKTDVTDPDVKDMIFGVDMMTNDVEE